MTGRTRVNTRTSLAARAMVTSPALTASRKHACPGTSHALTNTARSETSARDRPGQRCPTQSCTHRPVSRCTPRRCASTRTVRVTRCTREANASNASNPAISSGWAHRGAVCASRAASANTRHAAPIPATNTSPTGAPGSPRGSPATTDRNAAVDPAPAGSQPGPQRRPRRVTTTAVPAGPTCLIDHESTQPPRTDTPRTLSTQTHVDQRQCGPPTALADGGQPRSGDERKIGSGAVRIGRARHTLPSW